MLAAGEHEDVKAGVHIALGTLALMCVAYNTAAWLTRREKHLAFNAVIYAALLGLELQQVRRHLETER